MRDPRSGGGCRPPLRRAGDVRAGCSANCRMVQGASQRGARTRHRQSRGGGLTMENDTQDAGEAIYGMRLPGRRYLDRSDAGRTLAASLEQYKGRDVLVLGIPRGGVPVAAEVARALEAELDVIVARKLGAPGQPELAMGAVTSNG